MHLNRDVRDLAVELLKETGKHDQAAAKRYAAMNVQPATVAEQNDQAQLREELRRRREQRKVEENPVLLVGDEAVGFLEAAELMPLGGEPLDRLHPAHALGKERNHAVEQLAVTQVRRPQPGGVKVSDVPQTDSYRKASQCQRRLDAPHENKVRNQRQEHVDSLQHDAVNE